ncbi:MAG: DciA family protein [Candidatus Omnitrophota bacterium]
MKAETKKEIFLVNEILPEVIKRISRRDIQDQISLEKLWQDAAGEEAAHAVIAGFKDGCVFITVDNPARLFKMRLRKPGLLKKLKDQRQDIVNLSFRIGSGK